MKFFQLQPQSWSAGAGHCPAPNLQHVQKIEAAHETKFFMSTRRGAIVEPVFGQIHSRQGRHLLLRGVGKAAREWELIAGCHNLLKLHSKRTG